MAQLTIAFVRDVMNRQYREEISFSRMVELLNEEAQRETVPPVKTNPNQLDLLVEIEKQNELGRI